MKKIYVFALAAVMMAACSEDVLEEHVSEKNEAAAKSLLQVRTRTSDEAAIAYPVQVYVFQGDGSDEECMAVQTIGDEGQTLNIALTEGTYSVYAIGGASSTDYSLPTKEEAATTTAIALKEGKALTDLMTATATATLTDGGTNTVTLGLQRKTMLIQDVTIKKVPSAATAVSVTIAPLWQSLTVGGTYSTTGQSTTIALTKQEDNRTWKNSVSAFLLPHSSQPASVSVNITIDGTTKTYTYSTSDQLEAGYKINISGTYTEAIGVALTGTITGATWLGERTINFTFDENGSSTAGIEDTPGTGSEDTPGADGDDGSATGGDDKTNDNGGDDNNDNTDNQDNIPAVGSTYLGCYVLAVTDGEDHADVLVVAPEDITGVFYGSVAQGNVDAALGSVTVDGISGWEVPDRDEARLIFNARGSISGLTHDSYLCDNGGYKCFRIVAGVNNFSASNTPTSDTALRPVATVTIAKE